MFDLHRHFSNEPPTPPALYATSTQKEWELLTSVRYGGAGLLPHEPLAGLEAMYELLVHSPHLQIAEVGLDRRYRDLNEQEMFLRAVFDLALELDRSVTLHCVHADGRMMNILRGLSRRPRLLWHSFLGSYETATVAAKLGIILSYSPRLYTTKLAKEGRRLTELPFALESDYDLRDEEHYMVVWKNHQEHFANLAGWSIDELTRNNDEKRTILTH